MFHSSAVERNMNYKIMKEINITNDEVINSDFLIENSRTMDRFTKKILYTAKKLLGNDINKLSAYDTGIVIATNTGPYTSIKSISDDLRGYDYKQINPSFFANVMSSTALCYLAKYLGVHGPACAFFSSAQDSANIWEYVTTQLYCGNCAAMIMIYASDDGGAEGKYVIRKELIHEDSIY